MRTKFYLLVLLVAFVCSCRPVREYPYFQDWQDAQGDTLPVGYDITFKKKDKLKIMISCDDPNISRQFNYRIRLGETNTSNQGHLAYVIDENGDIEMPVLGKMHIEGLTRTGVIEYVKKTLIERDLIQNPLVYVEYVDFKVTLIGEISSKNYTIQKDQTNVIEVIAGAGDLDLLGRRPDILLIRNENGIEKFYTLNMDSIQVLQRSPAYYVQPDDIIYVQPTKRQARNTVINGNNLLSISFFMSTASFLMTLFLFFKNRI